jgi:thiol-disulfide isomerase/thioredoxin
VILKPKAASLLALAAALAVAVTAAGSSAATHRPLVAAGRAPEIVAPTIEGATFRLSAQRGKVVVLDFLTPGCGECEIAAPLLQRAATHFAVRGVEFVIVDLSNANANRLRAYYRDQLEVKRVAVVRDKGFRIGRAYSVLALGTTFVVGRNGDLAWRGSWHDSLAALDVRVSAAL